MKQSSDDLRGASASFTRTFQKLQTSTSFIRNPGLKVLFAFDDAKTLNQLETTYVPILRYTSDNDRTTRPDPHSNVGGITLRLIAIDKLLDLPRLSRDLSQAQIFALLGCTIQQPRRYNYYLNPTMYPSQFTLSMAANHFLADDDSRLISCIKALTWLTYAGEISSADFGDLADLAARIISMRAMQKAMSTSPIRTNQTHFPYGCSVRLVDFLKALNGAEESDMDLGNMEDSHKARLLTQDRIFWNHFKEITYMPDSVYLLRFLYRGLAILCKPNERGFDQMFPIYLEPEASDSILNEDHITFCGVQSKNSHPNYEREALTLELTLNQTRTMAMKGLDEDFVDGSTDAALLYALINNILR
ncbi:hypothetical protein PCANC_17940 [Puccinia coronata f. sp. avenae]|uniref:Uncharacterized protein n=1 Tax=Puccinia coronata f. sp. avenae TaxID=200324 RepID=A0A2N5SQA4_9BASI|nr:hypothetical protein PCANC_17940 [Puccinia coronata f. sp. avenae]